MWTFWKENTVFLLIHVGLIWNDVLMPDIELRRNGNIATSSEMSIV
jgi:hypothetical protein